MAVASVKVDRRTPIRAHLGSDGHRERVYRYLVVTTSPFDTEEDVANAAGLPAIFETHPRDLGSWVSDRSLHTASEAAGGHKWEIDITYTSRPRDYAGLVATNDPLARKPRVFYTFEDFETAVDVAAYYGEEQPGGLFDDFATEGKPVRNSAGEPFDEPLAKRQSLLVVNVVRNEASYSPTLALQMRNSVNASEIQIAGESYEQFVLFMRRFDGQPQYTTDPDVPSHFEVTYELVAKKDKWVERVTDVGWNELNDQGELTQITDRTGRQLTVPTFLNGLGEALARPVEAGGLTRFIYRVQDAIEFGGLNFPAAP